MAKAVNRKSIWRMYVFLRVFTDALADRTYGSKDMQRVWRYCVRRDRSRGLLFHGSSDQDVPEERKDRHAQPRRRRLKAWFLL